MKLKTQNTLRLISHYPLILLVIFSSYFLYLSYTQYESTLALKNKVESINVLSKLSIELAKERGVSASFYSSQGSIGKDALLEQRLVVNQAIQDFHTYFQSHEVSPHIKTVMTFLTKIVETRQAVDTFSIDFHKMFFNYYSQTNAHIIKEVEGIGSINTNSNISNLTYSLVMLYKNIEHLGQESGFIA